MIWQLTFHSGSRIWVSCSMGRLGWLWPTVALLWVATQAAMPMCRENPVTWHSVPTALDTSALIRCPGCIFHWKMLSAQKAWYLRKKIWLRHERQVGSKRYMSSSRENKTQGVQSLCHHCLSLPLDQNQLSWVNLESGRLQKRLTSKMKTEYDFHRFLCALPIFCIWWWPFSPP